MLFGSTGSNLNKLSNDSTFSSTAQKLHSNRMKIAFTSALSIIRINSLDVKREEKKRKSFIDFTPIEKLLFYSSEESMKKSVEIFYNVELRTIC